MRATVPFCQHQSARETESCLADDLASLGQARRGEAPRRLLESHDSVREFDRLNEIEVGAGVRVDLLKAGSFLKRSHGWAWYFAPSPEQHAFMCAVKLRSHENQTFRSELHSDSCANFWRSRWRSEQGAGHRDAHRLHLRDDLCSRRRLCHSSR